MKRVYVLILMIAVGAAVLGPLGFAKTGEGLRVTLNTALAASTDPGSGGGGGSDPFVTKDDKCPNGVRIGLPIFGTANCVDNTYTAGGAIINYLKTVLQLLSTAVGLVILLMLIVAGVQYITSTGEPAQIKAAKNRVVNAITALMLFLFMFAILSFLVPGGIF